MPSPQSEPIRRHRLPTAAVLAVIVGGSAVLKLWDIGGKSFWLDEAFSVVFVRAPWTAFVHELTTREANMGLYYLLLRPWLLIGSDETTVRLLSAIPAVLTIPVVYGIGARLIGPRTGLVAALLLAIDPLHLWAAQEARGYALVILFLACSTWAFVRALDAEQAPTAAAAVGERRKQTASWWGLYVATSTLALYSHFFAALVLAAQWGSLLARRDSVPWRSLLCSGVVILVLLAPLVAFLARPHDNIDWLRPALTVGLPATARAVFRGGALTALGIYVGLMVAVLALAATAIRTAASPRVRWAYSLLCLWVALPPVVAALVTVTLKPVLDPRYLVVCIPGFALVAAAWIERLETSRWRAAALAAVLAIDAVADWAYFTRYQKEGWREATAAVLGNGAASDVVLFYAPYGRRAYDYYVPVARRPTDLPREIYPSSGYAHFSHDTGRVFTITQALDSGRLATRAWLVLSHVGLDDGCASALDLALRSALSVVTDRSFIGVEVRSYGRPSTGPNGPSLPAPGSPAAPGATGTSRAAQTAPTAALVARSCPQE